MPLKLVGVEADSEFDELVRTLFAAYEQPENKTKILFHPQWEPGAHGREAAIQSAVQQQLGWHRSDPTSHWLKVIDTETGRMQGAVCWHVYTENPSAAATHSDSDKEEEEEEECDWWPAGEERDMVNALVKQLATPHTTHMRQPHILLENMFSHPDARRGGVGRLLMEWVVAEADKRGFDTYLDASPLGRELYRRYGFIEGGKVELSLASFEASRKREELEKMLLPHEWWPMFRPAGGKYEAGKTVLPWEEKKR